jgi:hypothetical protein
MYTSVIEITAEATAVDISAETVNASEIVAASTAAVEQ